ncbi:SMI1/KNR4 family protein [Salipaludibacillus sp. LMS25]|jgi:hypothetical protein|uniref:SMI1/KNR4 family protein n=1 Tax=Salipaludibacillus sp. LMS25 TaxID=2924031 RepID=UPI0020CFFFEC|nr:SMI1/KNR4 family protein [Salipaludibacillus sp. LMS25]UTR15000.1 SMI1/KNR4 family protein [Salipaludibacillus sp. LMS25]
MVKIKKLNRKITEKELKQFEKKNKIRLTEKYKDFLLKWNRGSPEPCLFDISKDQGTSVLNVFNGIDAQYDDLEEVIDIYEFRLPEGFIPIADDPSGNAICLGTKVPYYDHIYFWDHEQESETPDDMSNMYFLASDIDAFLNMLYEDDES